MKGVIIIFLLLITKIIMSQSVSDNKTIEYKNNMLYIIVITGNLLRILLKLLRDLFNSKAILKFYIVRKISE